VIVAYLHKYSEGASIGLFGSAYAVAIDDDATMAANSAAYVPTQAAVIAYVAAHAGGGSSFVVHRHAASSTPALLVTTKNFLDGNNVAAVAPTSPADGDEIRIYATTARTGCTLVRSGSDTVNGSSSAQALPAVKFSMTLIYDATGTDWFTENFEERA
jgi:hypothetical protein